MFDFKKTFFFLFLASFLCTARAEVFVYDRVGVLTAAIGTDSKSAVYAMDASQNILAASSSQPLGGAPGGQILVTATPAPFTNPASTGISAKVNLTSLGGNATAALSDAATNGDVTAGDGTFSLLANIGADTPLGAQLLTVTYTDAEGRTWQDLIPLSLSAGVPTMPLWGYAVLGVALFFLMRGRLPRRVAGCLLALALLSPSVQAQDYPMWENFSPLATLPPDFVNPSEIRSFSDYTLPTQTNVFQARAAMSVPASIDAEVQTLANALGDASATVGENAEAKALRIFTWVRNNIDYDHYYGLRKGAALTLLEGSGNDMDTCALLRELLVAAGYPSANVKLFLSGQLMSYATMAPWLGLAQTPYPGKTFSESHGGFTSQQVFGVNAEDEVAKQAAFGIDFLTVRGSTYGLGNPQTANPQLDSSQMAAPARNPRFAFSRMVVVLIIGSAGYPLDPSYKTYEKTTGTADLAALTGFNRDALLTTAGGTYTNQSAHSLSETNLFSYLTGLNTQLLGQFAGTLNGASPSQIVNGRRIVEKEVTTLSQAGPPATLVGSGVLFDSVSDPDLDIYKSTVNFLYGTMNYTLPTSELKGRKVTLTFTGNTAELRLDDGAPVATASVSGATMDLKITMTHPGRVGVRFITMRCKKNDAYSYALVYGFSASGRLIQKRHEQLKAYLDAGLAESSREVRSETLNIMGLNWMYQTELCYRLLADKNDALFVSHHRMGRMAQEEGFYVDVALQLGNFMPADASRNIAGTPRLDNLVHLGSLFASAMEHGIIEQMQPGSSAVSTVNILRKANNSANPVFLAKKSNWSAVSTQLVGYSGNDTTEFGSMINNSTESAILALPKTASVTQGSWTGSGWIVRNSSLAGMIINGEYKLAGGYSTARSSVASKPVYTQQAVSPARVYTAPSQPVKTSVPPSATAPRNYASDPVDMGTGAFIYASEDLATGLEGAPRGLGFSRSYSSNAATVDEQNLGYGWSHSFHIRATQRSATEEALALGAPKFAAPLLTAIVAASDLYRADASPREWVAATLAVAWFVDQMKDNAVSVRMGKDIFQFIKQPDGTFTAPPGSTMILTKATDGTYRLQQRLGNTIEFDAAGKATRIVDVDGQAMTFNYYTTGNNTGLLDYVEDHVARRFTFGYSGTHITSVTDSTSPARSVTFGYDTTNWNLTSATDPEGKVSYFDYSVAGDPGGTTVGQHRIVRLRNHDNETITQNVWDSLGRVERQFLHGDTSKPFRLYYTGRDNFEVNPQGGVTHYYYDERGRAVGSKDPDGNVNSMTYDGQDRIVTRTTGANETTKMYYDAAHNLTRIDHPRGGGSTLMEYDSLNRLDLVTDPNGIKTDYVYFTSGNDVGKDRPQSVISANGTADQSTTAFTYWQSGVAVGRVQTIKDGDNLTTQKNYDALGQPDTTTLPGSFTINEDYSDRGNLDSITDPNLKKTSYTYNQRRQPTVEVADSAGVAATSNSTFDNQARLATVTPPADNAGQRPQQSLTYNPTDKVRLKKLNGVTVVDTAYDSRDWVATVKDAASRTTTLVHKASGAVEEAQRPGARTTKFSYDGDKRVTSTQNPGANSGSRNEGFVYDTTSGGKPRTVKTEADGRTVTSEYDAAGRLRFVTDRKGVKFEFRYDALGRRTQVITPTGAATTTAYTKNGRAASVTEPSGDKTTFNYSATTGRLASAVHAGAGGATVNYTGYDANGNLLSLNEGGNGTITRTYDGLNRVTSYTEAGKTIGYRYYASGKLAKVIYPGGTETGVGHVEYTYNADGRLYQVIDRLSSTSSPRTTSYLWYSDGRLQSISRPNGTTRTITYDAVGRPEGITESAGLVWTIGYYASDDIRTLDMTPAIPANQLSAVPNASMTFDAANRLATFNGQTITHDLDGNMVSGPLPTTGAMGNYTYDSRNRLTGAGGFAYRYNAEWNRVGLTSANETTTLTVDPQGALPKVLERVKNGIRTRYVYGAGLQYEVNDAGSATYYHYDQSGNTAALTNQAGAIIERVVYSPYGTIRYRQSNYDTPFLYGGFFGVMTDANGLINMRARYYNPLTMRFLNTDPAMDGLNWYAYANGNPINFADPTGYAAQDGQSQYTSFANYLGIAFNRNGMVLVMEHSAQVVESSRNHGVNPNLVAATIMFEHRGWGLIPGSQYAEAALSYVRAGDNGSYGFAQLGQKARENSNLSIGQALSAQGSIEGAAAWLSVNKQQLIRDGIANPSDAQIATRYNWGNAPAGTVTNYGKNVGAIVSEVKWNFPKSNK